MRLVALLVALVLPFACVLGTSHEAGCESDADCPGGYSCRSGACFELTTTASPPSDPRDAGDGG